MEVSLLSNPRVNDVQNTRNYQYHPSEMAAHHRTLETSTIHLHLDLAVTLFSTKIQLNNETFISDT